MTQDLGKLCRVEIRTLNDRVNRNGWRYTDLARHLTEFRDVPILTAYTARGDGIGAGHNYTLRTDPATGEEYASFTDADAERIVGWVPGDARIELRREPDADWVVLEGCLWRWYSRELVDKICSRGGMEVSIETLVTREHRENGVCVEDEYTVLGITVLGDGVAPAVPGAGIRRLNEARARMQPALLRAAEIRQGTERHERHGDGSPVFRIKTEEPSPRLARVSENRPRVPTAKCVSENRPH